MDIEQISSIVRRVMNEEKETENFRPSDSANAYTAENITLSLANELIDRVIKKAAEIGVLAVAAVVNSGARPVSVQCADDSYIASYDIAMGKAYTAVSLKMKTSELKTLAAPNGSLYGIQHTNDGKIVIFGGGVPLKINNKIVGGFGVSGGSEEQDTYLGEYAEQVFREIIKES